MEVGEVDHHHVHHVLLELTAHQLHLEHAMDVHWEHMVLLLAR
jgi:hypothetical protein